MASRDRLLGRARKIGYRDTPVITLSSVQLLALDSTPVELIAAPGAGQAIFVEHYDCFLDFNSVAYTGGALQLSYTDNSGGVLISFGTWFRGSSDQYVFGQGDGSAAATVGTILTPNAPVVIGDAGTLADGNSPIKIRLRYRIIELLT